MVSDFERLVVDALSEEAERICELTKKEIELTAKDALEAVQNHPNIPVRTGTYRKSFALKKKTDTQSGLHYVVHNKSPEYRKAHLLEYGHVNRDGSRTRAFPHWKDAQTVADELPARLKRRIEGGA